MSIEVLLEDERGNAVSVAVFDAAGIIARSIPDLADVRCSCVRFINPYGDTVFNTLQAPVLLAEWDRLRAAFEAEGAAGLWENVRELVARCADDPHLYVRFIGD